MESSLKERIVSSLLKQVLLFIAFCVINKFFHDRVDWLFNSAMWCLILAVGHIISKNLITAMNIRNDYWGIAIDFVSIYLVAKLLSIFVPNVKRCVIKRNSTKNYWFSRCRFRKYS